MLQGLVALGCIIGGAELFVQEIKKVAEDLGVDALVLSLIIAPLATELPEKINSVIWMKAGKDRLAVGNVTGALAFQSTIPVAFGLAITRLGPQQVRDRRRRHRPARRRARLLAPRGALAWAAPARHLGGALPQPDRLRHRRLK